MQKLKSLYLAVSAKLMKPAGKDAFVKKVRHYGRLLDVGCGNNSAERVSLLRSDLYYIGVDIGDYNNTKTSNQLIDKLVLTNPIDFANSIESIVPKVDAIICAHNLEHCNDFRAVIRAMASVLDKNGALFLSYPCVNSICFPSRKGTLNFYDDPTHVNLIDTKEVVKILEGNGISVERLIYRYRPIVPFVIGLLFEPVAFLLKRNGPFGSTWALYGFETIVIGKKTSKEESN